MTEKHPGRILSAYWAMLDAMGVACGMAIGLICAGICADVIARVVTGGGIAWMLESIEYLQYAVVMTGATWVLCHGAHISLDILVVLLSERWQAVMQRVACVIGFVASIVFAVASLAATMDTWNIGGTIYKSITLPEWLPLAFLPVSFALMSVEFLLQLFGYARPREHMSL
jgi:TRAP-type C4-dicarboxylate transport system permease small subunit